MVEITGANFGPDIDGFLSVSYGRTGVGFDASCQWVSHNKTICTTAPGSGENLAWVVKVRGLSSEKSNDLTSYAKPEIVNMPTNGPTNGAYAIKVQGHNFAVEDGLSKTFVSSCHTSLSISRESSCPH